MEELAVGGGSRATRLRRVPARRAPYYLGDTSALARAQHESACRLDPLLEAGLVARCTPTDLEAGFSTTSPASHRALREARSAWPLVPMDQHALDRAVEVQNALAEQSQQRGATEHEAALVPTLAPPPVESVARVMQAWADALGDVCRFFLDHTRTRAGGRHRPHLNVIAHVPYGVLNRPPVEPDDLNGLREMCSLMVDRITTDPRRSVPPGRSVRRVGAATVGPMERDAARARLDEERDRLGQLRDNFVAEGLTSESEDESLGELSSVDQHQADVGTETFNRERDLSILESVQAELADVEHALQRLDDGTYGTCEACGCPIDEGRLEAVPAARFCLQDQATAEREVRLPGGHR